MQPAEHQLAVQMPAHDWPVAPGASAPCLLDAEALLREVLAAARHTVARCEHALVLLAGNQCLEPGGIAYTAWDADTSVVAADSATRTAGHDGRTLLDRACDGAGARSKVTPREMEVALLIASGLSNKQIAAQLYLSVRTVERHITNLYAKIGAYGKADATAWVLRKKLV
jgi:DNA-binding NarL/FixJ family response regulator